MIFIEVTWSGVFVGLGALLAGVGSVLSGLAALRAVKRGR